MSNIISIALILVLLIIIIISIKVSWSLTHVKKILPDESIRSEFVTLTDVTFKDIQNKVTLNGWYIKANNSDRTLILAHGYKSNRMLFNKSTSQLIKEALQRNYNVFTFDFRGSGTSEGDITYLGFYEKNDLLGAINYIKNNGSKYVTVLGFSMGGATSLLAVSENPGLVDALICEASFTDLKSYLYKNLPVWSNLPTFPFSYLIVPISSLITGINPSDVNPLKAIGKIPADKLMLIHSEDDTTVPYSDCLNLFKASDSAAKLLIVKNAPHGKILEQNSALYLERIFLFMDERMASASQKDSPKDIVDLPVTPVPSISTPNTEDTLTPTQPLDPSIVPTNRASIHNSASTQSSSETTIPTPKTWTPTPSTIPTTLTLTPEANIPNPEVIIPHASIPTSEVIETKTEPTNTTSEATGSTP